MSRSRHFLIAPLLLALMLLSLLLFAAEKPATQMGALPQLSLPANASACVEPTEIMRRYHMDFLMQQRDATVIEGIRSKKYSLSGCIDCHNPRIGGQQAVRYENPQHFCAACHGFTGVKIDCFECHADRGTKSS